MRRDVHLEALRIAAKVVLSIGLLEGCTPARVGEPRATAPAPEADEPATTRAPDPVYVDDTPPAPTDCRAAITAAFPVPSDYPGERKNVTTAVQNCCAEAIVNHIAGEWRWDCCANLPEVADNRVHMSCTPWGPPVPPAMPRRTIERLA